MIVTVQSIILESLLHIMITEYSPFHAIVIHIEINKFLFLLLKIHVQCPQDRPTVGMIEIMALSTLHPMDLTDLNHHHIFHNGNLDQFLVKFRLLVNCFISTLMTTTMREIQ